MIGNILQIDDIDWRSWSEADLLGAGAIESGVMRESGKSNLFDFKYKWTHPVPALAQEKQNDDVLTIIIV